MDDFEKHVIDATMHIAYDLDVGLEILPTGPGAAAIAISEVDADGPPSAFLRVRAIMELSVILNSPLDEDEWELDMEVSQVDPFVLIASAWMKNPGLNIELPEKLVGNRV